MKIRQIEYYRLWSGNSGSSGTWDTDYVDIPADTPEDKIDEVAKAAINLIGWTDEVPIATGIYHVPSIEADEAVCEICGKPAPYDSDLCLCSEHEAMAKDALSPLERKPDLPSLN